MSSLTTRNAVRQVLTDQWAATPWFDISDYTSVDDIPNPDADPWVLIEFIGGGDEMVTIGGTGGEDGYREDGVIYFHYIYPTGMPYIPQMTNMEALRNLFKNKRLGGDVVIENIDTFTDREGASIEVDGGFHGWSAACYYYTDTHVL